MEEEIKEPTEINSEINPDTLDAVFEVETTTEDEEEALLFKGDDTELDADEIDLAFVANDEGDW